MAQTRTDGTETQQGPWYAGLTRSHRRVLAATFGGWTFDGYETFALILVVGPMLTDLLDDPSPESLTFHAGLAIGLTLLGWGIGGIVGGVAADYIGRKRMMTIAILGYAVFTGLTALSTSVEMLIAFRILTGVAMGSEWSTGTALIHETWPERARAKGAGFMQSGFGFGTLLAALLWYVIGPTGPSAWRWMFVIGIAPAFLILYIRRRLTESARWQQAVAQQEASGERREFTLAAIFRRPDTRRTVLLTLLASLGTIIGWYAVSAFLGMYVEEVAKEQGVAPEHWVYLSSILYNVGSVIGYLVSGFVADALGRRRFMALIFGGSLVMTPVTYLWGHVGGVESLMAIALVNGAFTLGGFAWFAIYLPELFGSEVRSTACSFVFNATRLIAWLGPIVSGSLIATLGSVSTAAVIIGTVYVLGLVVLPFLRETKGEGLPA